MTKGPSYCRRVARTAPKVPISLFVCPFRVESGFVGKRRPASSATEAKAGALRAARVKKTSFHLRNMRDIESFSCRGYPSSVVGPPEKSNLERLHPMAYLELTKIEKYYEA